MTNETTCKSIEKYQELLTASFVILTHINDVMMDL